MSLLDDFVRVRLHRNRASEYELLAESEPLSEVRLRYRPSRARGALAGSINVPE